MNLPQYAWLDGLESTSVLFRIMRAQNIDPNKDFKLLQVPVGSEAGPLLAGQAKCAVLYEPGTSQAESKGMKVVLGFPEPLGPYLFSAISTRQNIDPETAQKFVNSIQLTLVDIQNNPAGAIEVGKKLFPTLEPSIIDGVCHTTDQRQGIFKVGRNFREGTYRRALDTGRSGQPTCDPSFRRRCHTRLYDQGDRVEPQVNSFGKIP